MLQEEIDMTKTELKQLIKSVFKDEFAIKEKKILSKDDVRDVIKSIMKKHYKDLWQRSSIIIDNL